MRVLKRQAWWLLLCQFTEAEKAQELVRKTPWQKGQTKFVSLVKNNKKHLQGGNSSKDCATAVTLTGAPPASKEGPPKGCSSSSSSSSNTRPCQAQGNVFEDKVEASSGSGPRGPHSARPLLSAARAPADEVSGWLEKAITRFVDDNPTALQIHGDCPSPLRWSALQRMVTRQFGHVGKELTTVLRDHAFLLLLKLVNPAQFSAWEVGGHLITEWALELRDEFGPWKATRVPRFDEEFTPIPVLRNDALDPDRVDRRAVSILNRARWEAICDYIEAELATINLQMPGHRWSIWSEARADIEDACGPLDSAFADYAKDFLCESMGLMIHPPQSPSLRKPAARRQRRSRAKNGRLWDDPDCHSSQDELALPEDEDWMEGGLPSDFEGFGEW